jgi:hypothetical protein
MADFRESVLEHIKCSHAALDVANTELTKQAQIQQEYEAGIEGVVDALIKHERLDPSMREKAAQLLKDPRQMQKILLKAADTQVTVKPKAMGTPTGPEKRASDSRPRYTGERTSAPSAADDRFAEALLGK